jgi:hypothetical protein
MGEEVTFQVSPGSFDIVEFRSILWQPLDGEPGPLGQCGPRQLADVDRAVVEDQDDGDGESPRLTVTLSMRSLS